MGAKMPELKLRPLTKKESQQLPKLEHRDPSDLETEFGQSIGTLSPGEAPEKATRTWLNNRRDELQQLICVDCAYCDFISKNKNAKFVEIVAALSDVLAGVFGGVPVNTLAALLLRQGLDDFCDCESRTKPV
jgi:hypothetical protein